MQEGPEQLPGEAAEPEEKKKSSGPKPKRPPKALDVVAPAPLPQAKKRVDESTTHETPAETKQRLSSQAKDDELRRHKDKVTFWVFLVLLVLVAVGSAVAAFAPNVPPDRAKSAENLFIATASGIASYFFGKAKGEART